MATAYSILSVCLDGALKTHVMFKSNLNSRQLHFYLESLVEKGLLEEKRIPLAQRWSTEPR
jgi:predicted transcriptional regulator